MELISGHSEVAVSGSLQMNYTPSQIRIEANEDVAAASEIIIDNPEHVVVDKTLIVQKKIVVKEKVIIPKSNPCFNHCEVLSDVQIDPQTTTIEILKGTEEMDNASQASLESKMELGSQESGELTMEICSQESISSKMELCSQENILTDPSLESGLNFAPVAPNVPVEEDFVNKTPISNDNLLDEDNLRRRKRANHNEESLDQLQCAYEASLLIREKAVTEREAAVLSREKLIQNLENSILDHIEHSTSKQRKKVKIHF